MHGSKRHVQRPAAVCRQLKDLRDSKAAQAGAAGQPEQDSLQGQLHQARVQLAEAVHRAETAERELDAGRHREELLRLHVSSICDKRSAFSRALMP